MEAEQNRNSSRSEAGHNLFSHEPESTTEHVAESLNMQPKGDMGDEQLSSSRLRTDILVVDGSDKRAPVAASGDGAIRSSKPSRPPLQFIPKPEKRRRTVSDSDDDVVPLPARKTSRISIAHDDDDDDAPHELPSSTPAQVANTISAAMVARRVPIRSNATKASGAAATTTPAEDIATKLVNEWSESRYPRSTATQHEMQEVRKRVQVYAEALTGHKFFVRELLADLEAMQKYKDELELKVKNLKAENATKPQVSKDTVGKKDKKSQAEKEEDREYIEALEEENRKLKAKNAKAEGKLAELKDNVETLEDEKGQLVAEKEVAAEELAELENTVKRVEKNLGVTLVEFLDG